MIKPSANPRPNRQFARVSLVCQGCGSSYEVHRCEAEGSRFCRPACRGAHLPPKQRPCETCGAVFSNRDRAARFCSCSCARKSQRGPRANAWKGGVSLLNERGRQSNRLRAWSRSVKERDGFCCVRCGASGGYLHSHHIKSFSSFPDLRFEVSNGETLCVTCHGVEHGKDFGNRRFKHCRDCGVKTKGYGPRCKSCAVREQHRVKRHGSHAELFLVAEAPSKVSKNLFVTESMYRGSRSAP